jgi:dolichol kinase
MVELSFSSLTLLDILLIILVDSLAVVSLAVSCALAKRGEEKWVPRKFSHIAISSVIGLALPFYSSLTGPAITLVIFLVGIFGCSLVGPDVKRIALSAGTRKDGSQLQTFIVSVLTLIAFAVVFLIFINVPAIFVSSILAVSWGDGAGEAVGRPLGRHKYHVWAGNTKSLEGSLAVIAMTFIGVMFAFFLFPVAIPVDRLLFTALVVSLAVSGVEIVSVSGTDNAAIPIVSSSLLWALLLRFV